MKRVDRWLAAALLAFAGLWSWAVLATIPGPQAPGEPGPQQFPLLLGAGLALLALWVLGATFAPAKDGAADEGRPTTRREVRVVGATFALLLLYGFLMARIGFVLATPVVLVLAMAGLLGRRNWRGILAIAFGFTAACHVIFNVLLQANLPHGTWISLF